MRSDYCNSTTLTQDSTIACDPVSMGDIYEFEFTDLSNASVTLAQSDLIYLSLDSVIPNLMTGHTYAVRVRGFVYNTWSAFGTVCNITISGSPVNAASRTSAPDVIAVDEKNTAISINNIDADQLSAYPNPFKEQSGFMVKSSMNKNVTVFLVDALGKMIWSKVVVTNQYETYNTQDLAPGLYFMSSSENSHHSVKIIKTK